MVYVKWEDKVLYLIGLVFDGGVYFYINYLKVLFDIVVVVGLMKIYIYVFMDGWDISLKGGKGYLVDLLGYIKG